MRPPLETLIWLWRTLSIERLLSPSARRPVLLIPLFTPSNGGLGRRSIEKPANQAFLRRRIVARPARPSPNRASVAGSGTEPF